MATEILETAPYAPPANVVDVLHHVRKRGLPDTLTQRVLASIGIPDGNVSRTLAAFRFLKLIEEENGECTATFQRLARATDEEYPEQLAQVIREAYKTVFTYVDPADDDTIKLNNVFRQHYNPQAQRTRMVTLFLGLCREAGIVSGSLPEPRLRTKRPPASKEHTVRQNKVPRMVQMPEVEQTSLFQAPPSPSLAQTRAAYIPDVDGYYAMCMETLKRLPTDHKWTKGQRVRWLEAIRASVDLLVEVSDEKTVTTREVTVVDAGDSPF